MKIAVTGATGFIGRYILRHLAGAGHSLRSWYRPSSDRLGLDDVASAVEWLQGDLNDERASPSLVAGCDAVVHAALWRPGTGFRGVEGDLIEFVERNVVGTLRLIEAARKAGVSRFIFVSTCAVHEKILDDHPLDETHPTWATSHYGAHKAAIEQFVYSFGLGDGYPICALRPSGVYGVAHSPPDSKWFDLVKAVASGKSVACQRGGKEVHAADVAKAAEVLLNAQAEAIAGQTFNCCDRYVSEWEVAHLARQFSGSSAEIHGSQTAPKNQIVTDKLRSLGMKFGGQSLLERTVAELVST
ncbi:MAG TPA: NAD(P)-dependent oxidoreductase [Pirellulaceae bacterium]|nr:NAD(P)-dependent oxidoreductase [Pirellulaceae bacterium]